MKTVPFTFEGQDYSFKLITDAVKDELTDHMTAERMKTTNRLLKAGLISAEDYQLEKSNAHVKWGSLAFASDITVPKFAKMFIRLLLNEPVEDAVLDKMMDNVEEVKNALELVQELSEPKK